MNKSIFISSITKILSANDIGNTKSHQAGILVPKSVINYGYFPVLNSEILNPREVIEFIDCESGKKYKFNFIFYNNKMISNGTRSEYRLTGIRTYLFEFEAKIGDELDFGFLNNTQVRSISVVRRSNTGKDTSSKLPQIVLGSSVIKLQSGWKVVNK